MDITTSVEYIHIYVYTYQNIGVGRHSVLQGIFPAQGSDLSLLCFLYWQVDSLLLSHWGSSSLSVDCHLNI